MQGMIKRLVITIPIITSIVIYGMYRPMGIVGELFK